MASNAGASCPSGSDNSLGPRIDFDCRHFDFTLLFEDAVFHLVPAALFLFVIPLRIYSLGRSPIKLATYKLALWKLVTLSVVFATFYSLLEDQRSVRPSDTLILYFSATAILDLPRLRTLWLIQANLPKALWTVIFILTVLVVPLESISKKRFLRPTYRSLTKEEGTGFWGRSFFTWLLPFFRLGYSRVIHMADMPDVDPDLTSEGAGQPLETAWARRRGRKHHALLRSNFAAYRTTALLGVLTRLFLTAFTFCQPFLITATVSFMQAPRTPQSERYGQALVGAYVLTYLGIAVSRAAYSRQQFRLTTGFRAGLMSMIFKQTIALKADELKDGAAVTLMGTDVEQIVITFGMFHEVWAAVVEVGIAVFLLERQIAVASVVPVIISLLCVVGVVPISNTIGRAQTVWLERLQERVAVTAAMISDMKAIKMLGLPGVLSGVVTELRRVELKGSEKFRQLLLWKLLVSNLPTQFAPFATFVIYSIIAVITKDQTLTATNAFTALSLISLLTQPLLFFTQCLPSLIQGIACFARIEAYLLRSSTLPASSAPEPPFQLSLGGSGRRDVELAAQPSVAASNDTLTSFDTASVSWSPSSETVFRDLNLKIGRGITMIIGPIGCGKSCLIESIIGETAIITGSHVAPSQRIAYCSQNAWMLNGSLRNNITGGLDYEPKWFERVLWLCALTEDVQNITGGDMYNVGSNAVGLSGGQRQRVALARAVYSRNKLVILDDIFSGLDSKSVSKISARLFAKDGHFCQNGISVILATHTRHLIQFADEVIVLDNGSVLSQGPYEQVVAESSDMVLVSAPDEYNNDVTDERSSPTPEDAKSETAATDIQSDEDRLRQNGSWTVYKYYVEQGGWVAFTLFMLATITESFASGFTTVWFQWWVDANEKEPNHDLGKYLGVYAVLFTLGMLGLTGQCWLMFIRIINTSATALHADLLWTSMRAPLSFFQSTDTGSITNRFSQDLDLVDKTLPSNAINFAANGAGCVVKLIILCVMGKYLATSIPLLIGVLFLVQRYYLRTSRQVRLLDIEAKAPIYTHFLETLKGVATIRAYGWQDNFEKQAAVLLNRSQKPHYALACIQQWLALVLDLVVGALALIVVAMATSLTDKFSSGAVGVAMVLVLGFNSDLAMTIKNWTSLETSIGAVARIRQFTTETPSEERDLGEVGVPPSDWPFRGGIEFENVTARYTLDAEATLKGLSLSIAPGQKIAVCGPSGSGKTSLVLSLLQMIEVSEGRILIDGVDLGMLERSEVRARINVIPQEPFFLPGTVRFNLDPHSRVSSDDIKSALDKVGLLGRVGMSGGLDAELDATAYSAGERQLLALTRAVVAKSQVLILDEATSSVDNDTESRMQDIIDREFSKQTVISIIHRLRFADRYDRVLLLKQGRAVEWDSPKALLERDSEFRRLFAATQHSK
ncbi:ABC transporter atnG [Colletotrichum orbiculare MAFF 240422]|uniref:ABC transporter atnG n=1 Tax=Colletotrichum orbiculare (strain 104-T / ATCC 96160 / CBS 514.97 / LARS 414 / MAFF 240422) TaxID=1213857 RepID=A0A484FQA7_COLOR|nr:ABC transporter atnG [Colletotrichum orbiculare MAFF 240422]